MTLKTFASNMVYSIAYILVEIVTHAIFQLGFMLFYAVFALLNLLEGHHLTALLNTVACIVWLLNYKLIERSNANHNKRTAEFEASLHVRRVILQNIHRDHFK